MTSPIRRPLDMFGIIHTYVTQSLTYFCRARSCSFFQDDFSNEIKRAEFSLSVRGHIERSGIADRATNIRWIYDESVWPPDKVPMGSQILFHMQYLNAPNIYSLKLDLRTDADPFAWVPMEPKGQWFPVDLFEVDYFCPYDDNPVNYGPHSPIELPKEEVKKG